MLSRKRKPIKTKTKTNKFTQINGKGILFGELDTDRTYETFKIPAKTSEITSDYNILIPSKSDPMQCNYVITNKEGMKILLDELLQNSVGGPILCFQLVNLYVLKSIENVLGNVNLVLGGMKNTIEEMIGMQENTIVYFAKKLTGKIDANLNIDRDNAISITDSIMKVLVGENREILTDYVKRKNTKHN
jgi:hypothetical protein